MSEASQAAQRPTIRVDIVSDVMCPWCFIGMKHLEEAARQVSDDIDVVAQWLPFQLDPTLPKEGKDRALYLSEKFGGEERAKEIYARVKDAGNGAGIAFDFDAIAVSPNTFDAHRLIALAGRGGSDVQNQLVQALFKAFFLDGKNVGDNAVLADIAASVGMDAKLVDQFLESDELKQEVSQMLESVHTAGISGVPFFIINRKAALPGAQPPNVIATELRKAATIE